MEQNHIAHSALSPEAATDEPASSIHPVPSGAEGQPDADEGVWPDFATEEEACAYYRGLAQGIRAAGREPGHPHMPRDFSLDLTRDPASPGLVSSRLVEAWPEEPVSSAAKEPAPPAARAVRHDGWTGAKQRRFLDALAASGVVADACRAAGMGRDGAYELRKRAEGRAFALAWDAAILLSRRAVADDVMSRSRHGVIDRVYRNGELVAERHRYDNRLTMAVLARLDRLAEGMGEGAAVANAVAGEWDQFLDIVEAGGDGAEDFLRARSNPPRHGGEAHRMSGGHPSTAGRSLGDRAKRGGGGPLPRGTAPDELQSAVSLLSRLAAYKKFAGGLPHEIPVADLDPAGMEGWTDEQWARAEFSGLLDSLPANAWPAAALQEEADEPDGMCRVRRLYLERHPAPPPLVRDEGDDEEEEEEEDDFEGCDVWEDAADQWVTNFPPPPGFNGYEEGEPGEEDYKRELSPAELEAIGADPEALEAERAELVTAQQAARLRYFGFAAGDIRGDDPSVIPDLMQGPPSSAGEDRIEAGWGGQSA